MPQLPLINLRGTVSLLEMSPIVSVSFVAAMGHNSAKYVHTVIEATKLSFADSLQYCADMDHVDVPLKQLLSKDYAAKRRRNIQPDK